VQIIGDDRSQAQVDTFNEALITQDEIHANIHRGVFYTISDLLLALTNGSNEDLLLVTGDTPVHARITLSTSAQALVRFYEDTTTSNNGTVLPARNRNRVSTNTAAMTSSRAPTVTGVGTLLYEGFLPGGSKNQATGDQSSTFEEWVLKANSKYLIRVTNNSGGNEDLSLAIDFYEPS
jgi:hypothetical protein